jgi:S-adenosyl methyltransferase
VRYRIPAEDGQLGNAAGRPALDRRDDSTSAWRRDDPHCAVDGLEIMVPDAGRVYDAMLGGGYNFNVDREFASRVETAWPGATLVAHANRAYLRRVVRWLVKAGVHQFLDIGCGISTLGSVYEVVQKATSDARVVYVDIDPVVVAHSRRILAGDPRAHAVLADLRRPGDILYHPDVLEWLDFGEPIAVLMLAVLPFIPDRDNPAAILSQVDDALVAGSYLAISHIISSPAVHCEQEMARRLYETTPSPFYLRTAQEVAELLAGWDLVEPGLVTITDWHPDPEDDTTTQPSLLAALASKRRDGPCPSSGRA